MGFGLSLKSTTAKNSRPIIIFYNRHDDAAPITVMHKTLPFISGCGIKAFCAETALDKPSEIKSREECVKWKKLAIEDDDKNIINACEAYLKFLQSLNAYDVEFNPVDRSGPYVGSTKDMKYEDPIAARAEIRERNDYMSNKVQEATEKNGVVFLVGLAHLDIGCSLTRAGHELHQYLIINTRYRPEDTNTLRQHSAKLGLGCAHSIPVGCGPDHHMTVTVIDTYANPKLNATKIVLNDLRHNLYCPNMDSVDHYEVKPSGDSNDL